MKHYPALKLVPSRLVIGLGCLTIVAAILGLAFCLQSEPGQAPAIGERSEPPMALAPPGNGVAEADPVPPTSIQKRWGIEIRGLRLTVGGRMLDLRYRILDTKGAAELALQEFEGTYLVIAETGERIVLPSVSRSGTFRRDDGSRLHPGRGCSLFFPNPGMQLQPGSEVSLVMGEFRADHLIVQ